MRLSLIFISLITVHQSKSSNEIYLVATELLYVMYIGSVARNRMSKKLERLLSVMLLPIIFDPYFNLVEAFTEVGFSIDLCF